MWMYKTGLLKLYPTTPDRQYGVCTVAAVLDNCFTWLVFCGLSCFPWLHHFVTLSTLWKEMEIAEKEGGLPVFDNGN